MIDGLFLGGGGVDLSTAFPISCSLESLFGGIRLGLHSKWDQSYFGNREGGVVVVALVEAFEN